MLLCLQRRFFKACGANFPSIISPESKVLALPQSSRRCQVPPFPPPLIVRQPYRVGQRVSFSMESSLKDFFGFSKFRPFQKEIIKRILQGQDCLVVMATGSGKSLCYQMPPLMTQKIAIVISPLISLMQDQVMSLKERGIKAEYLSSAQTDTTVASRALKGEYYILYMTPEKAANLPKSFWLGLLQKGVSLLAVDEAHCVSEWGHDFRHEYRELHKLRWQLPNVPFVAVTATATERVRDDIATSLHLHDEYTVVSTFDRPNLFYGVKTFNRSNSFREELAKEVMKDVQAGGSTIIYCTTIKDVEEVTDALSNEGVKAKPYHGQMKQKDRDAAHREFTQDELQIIVATVAFGMGIDKPDIRRVIHYGCPKSLESYYQESGRCGRDGLPSACLMYYTRGDFAKADFYTAEARTEERRKAIVAAYQAAQKYCSITSCRRRYILEYFGEIVSFYKCGKCDNCTSLQEAPKRDMSEEAHLLISCVKACGGRFGLNMPIDVLRGSRIKKVLENNFDELPVYGLGRTKSANWWKSLGDQLLALGYLKEIMNDVYRLINIGPLGEEFLSKSRVQTHPIILPVNQEMAEEERKKTGSAHQVSISVDSSSIGSNLQTQGFSETEVKFYNALLTERAEIAKRNSAAPYAICSEKTVQTLAKLRPSTKARLLNIDGVNQWLVKKHGDDLIGVIQKLSSEFGLLMDNVETPQPTQPGSSVATKSSTSTHGYEAKVSPAKLEAWRMWQEEGISISEIANLPDRPAPIKEETVVSYMLDCIRAGYKVDWDRLCKETGLTNVAEEVRIGIQKAGSKEKLKPIKENVPENVSYVHIKIYLLMEEMNLPFPTMNPNDKAEPKDNAREEGLCCDSHSARGVECNMDAHQHKSAVTRSDSEEGCLSEPPWMDGEEKSFSLSQRRRIPFWNDEASHSESALKRIRHAEDAKEAVCSLANSHQQVTEEALLAWLSAHDGVPLDAIMSAFPASKDIVTEFLSKLEADFLIYRKNETYRLM